MIVESDFTEESMQIQLVVRATTSRYLFKDTNELSLQGIKRLLEEKSYKVHMVLPTFTVGSMPTLMVTEEEE